MTHPKYGDKFTCFQCETRFYDMGKPDSVCPKCGANQKKAPKKSSVKAAKPIVVPDFDAEEDTIETEIVDFPAKEETQETFDPDDDSLPVDVVPGQEF